MTLFHIQNSDINVGPMHYAHLEADELLVTKIFYTLQGEGPHAGKPAMFIRLAGCNRGNKEHMGCAFCDTQFQFHQGEVLTFDQIERQMQSLLSDRTIYHEDAHEYLPMVVITGGEPMIQDNLTNFLGFLLEGGWDDIQIESNGDRLSHGLLDAPWERKFDLVVSPKVTKHGYLALKPQIFERADALKFLIDCRHTSPYYDVPEYAKNSNKVWLSPITVYRKTVPAGMVPKMWDASLIDHDQTAANYQRAAHLAMLYGYRVSIQQHLFYGVE